MPKKKVTEGRIGSSINPRLYRKLNKITRIFGRNKSDLLKEAIWEIISQKNQKGGENMLYVLNTLVLPVDFEAKRQYEIYLERIDIELARKMLSEKEFISAVGHEATAKLLTEMLGIEIPFNRIAVKLRPGDMCLHFVLRTRLPEGKVLSEKELKKLEYDLVLSKVD
jgi:hypothetical protein